MSDKVPTIISYEHINRLSSKAMKLLQKKAKSPIEIYAACRLICIFYEETVNASLAPESEKELRSMVQEAIKKASS